MNLLPLLTRLTFAKSLAVFRIALGLLMLAELATTAPSLAVLYGPRGFLQPNLKDQITSGSSPPLFNPATRLGMTYDEILMLIFGLQGVALAFFTIGKFTRVATITAWLGQTFFMNSSVLALYGVDRYLHAFILLSVFLPLSAVWSVDSLPSLRKSIQQGFQTLPEKRDVGSAG